MNNWISVKRQTKTPQKQQGIKQNTITTVIWLSVVGQFSFEAICSGQLNFDLEDPPLSERIRGSN